MCILCSGRCGCEVGFKFNVNIFNVNICYGYFAMVGWYGMGPDISVMKARWQAVSRTLGTLCLGNMKTAICCRCQKTLTLTEPGSVENLRLQHWSLSRSVGYTSRSAQTYTS
jgi:hypothetical protein